MADATQSTLIAVAAFLAASVEWCVSEPDFPLEDYAGEVAECVRVLRRWDVEAEDRGTMVQCPTLHEDDGECGARLYYRTMDEHVTCPRCRVTRDAATLVAVAMSDGRDVWVDPEAAASWLGVSEGTLRQWARQGRIERDHGRYRIRQQEATA